MTRMHMVGLAKNRSSDLGQRWACVCSMFVSNSIEAEEGSSGGLNLLEVKAKMRWDSII